MKNIVIKVENDKKDSMKPFYRMDALANVLKENCDVIFLCNKEDIKGINYLKSRKYNIREYEKATLKDVIIEYYGNNIIIDSHDKMGIFEHTCIKRFKKVIQVYEKADKSLMCDMLINPTYGSEYLNYLEPPSCKIISGRDAILIREEVREIPMQEPRLVAENILVILGETNSNTVTIDILKELRNLEYNFKVILSEKLKGYDKITQKFTASNIQYYLEEDFLSVAPTCDMAIAAYNYNIYELLTMGIPIIGVSLNREKIAQGQYLLKDMLVKGFGAYETKEIVKQTEILASNLVERKKLQQRMKDVFRMQNNLQSIAKDILNLIGE
ncbi:MAG: hypothetical protein BEN19_07170 [Epulopiscium sp. Nuni2H_MBin003]|nr:MAG: hypothetical protein BEN19_07170 [Epulopiscium sp. Nuni2H_MBin003]